MVTSNRTYEDASDDFDDLYDSPIENEEELDDFDDDYTPYTCMHGMQGQCNDCDDYEYFRGGIDKCMCCGRYKYNDELTYPGQTCIKGCVNPNEY